MIRPQPTIAEIDAADRRQLRAWLNDPTCVLVGAELRRLSERVVAFMRADKTSSHKGHTFTNPDAA